MFAYTHTYTSSYIHGWECNSYLSWSLHWTDLSFCFCNWFVYNVHIQIQWLKPSILLQLGKMLWWAFDDLAPFGLSHDFLSQSPAYCYLGQLQSDHSHSFQIPFQHKWPRNFEPSNINSWCCLKNMAFPAALDQSLPWIFNCSGKAVSPNVKSHWTTKPLDP